MNSSLLSRRLLALFSWMLLLIISYSFSSCATHRSVLPSERIEEHRLNSNQSHHENQTFHHAHKDSVYVEHIERQVHDTVYIRDTRYVERVLHDSVDSGRTDTVYVESVRTQTQRVQVPFVPRFYRYCTAFGILCAIAFAIYAARRLYLIFGTGTGATSLISILCKAFRFFR